MILIDPLGLKAIVDAAEASFPDEACGLLVGQWVTPDHCSVTNVVASENVAADRSAAFEIDPALRLDLQRTLRGSDNRVVGIYHSHPDQSAQPSARDLKRAWESDLVWLVTSVLAGEAVLTSAQVIAQTDGRQRFRETLLRTSDWEPDRDRPAVEGPGLNALDGRLRGAG